MCLIQIGCLTATRTELRRDPISALPFNLRVPHSSNSEELEEFAASYALEALGADERTEFREHIALCEVCATLTAEFADSADAISETLEPIDATSGLKRRVLDAAVAGITEKPTAPISITSAPTTNWFASVLSTPRYQAIAAAIAVITIGALVTWNVALQVDSSGDDAQPIFASAEFLYNLEGTDAAPGASGAVYRASEHVGLLLLRDLPPAGPGNVYQAWRIVGSEALPEDTFTISNTDSAIVSLNLDVLDADTIVINIEPEGGNTVPTGAVLLAKAS